jgi:hypothetical protein
MMQRQFPQHLFTLGSQRQQHLAPVLTSTPPPDITRRREPVNQFYCAVMPNLQTLRQLSDTRPQAFGWTFYRQHQLVLPRLYSGFSCGLLTKVKKSANLVAQRRQRLVIIQGRDLQYINLLARRFLRISGLAAAQPARYRLSRKRFAAESLLDHGSQATASMLLLGGTLIGYSTFLHYKQILALGAFVVSLRDILDSLVESEAHESHSQKHSISREGFS